MSVEHNESRPRSADGTQLYVQRWAPSGDIKAELLVLHGYMEHGARYREMAHHLAASGIATTALDYRGHGKAEGRRGYVKPYERYYDDVEAAMETIPNGAPRFVLGHSAGGLLGLDYTSRRTPAIKGLIVTNPFLAPGGGVPKVVEMAARGLHKFLPKLRLPAGVDPMTLTHVEEICHAYARDPMVFNKITLSWVTGVFDAADRVRAIDAIPVPLMYVWSDGDQVAHWEDNKQVADNLGGDDKTIVELPGQYHEVLNETDRVQLFDQIRDWITERA